MLLAVIKSDTYRKIFPHKKLGILLVFLEATKASNSSNAKSHFQLTHGSDSSGDVTTVSRATGVPDVYRTLHFPLSPLTNS